MCASAVRELVLALPLTLVGCGEVDPCSREALQQALDRARPGESVPFGACAVLGPLRVPAGVRLVGSGPSISSLRGEGVVLELEGSFEEASIESHGEVAVRARGTASLRGVEIALHSGIGVASIEASMTLDDVRIVGRFEAGSALAPEWVDVTPSRAHAAAASSCAGAGLCEPGEERPSARGTQVCDACGVWRLLTSTHGLVLVGGTANLTSVEVTGTASAAVLIAGGTHTATQLQVHDVLGTGVLASGGALSLRDTTIERALRGVRGAPAIALAARDTAVSTTRVVLTEHTDLGIVQAGGRSEHTMLTVSNTGSTAVWTEGALSNVLREVRVEGAGGEAIQISHGPLEATDVAVVGTRLVPRLVGVRLIELGDGLVLRDVPTASFERFVADANERVGLRIETSAMRVPYAFADSVVRSEGTARGALAGPRLVRPGTDLVLLPLPLSAWPAGLVREGTAAVNDGDGTGLEVPPIETPSLPSAAEVLAVVMPIM